MSKLITILVLVVLGVYFIRRMANRQVPPPDSAKGKDRAPEDMVRCKVCGVNLPRSEAILSQGRFYCCDAHRRDDS